MRIYLALNRLVFHICLTLALTACGKKEKGDPEQAVKQDPAATASAAPKASLDQFEHRVFPSAGDALLDIMSKTKPKVIGFGEFHQQDHTVKTVSSLKRFTVSLLPLISKKTSDLVVETWVSAGNCGETEKRVVAEVEEVSKRPAHTENETITLLKQAKFMGITPHILEIACDDYDNVRGDGGVDYLAMLELVKARLEKKGQAILAKKEKQKKGGQIVAIYCGAIHNDAVPEEIWESVSFGPKLDESSNGGYVEIDLYVPEFIENSDIAKKEAWYPLFRRLASPKGAVLIKRSKNAYIIIYKRGVGATPN